MLSVDHAFVKAYTCYRLTTVAVILVNREFSLLNVVFQNVKRFRNIYKALGKHSVLYKNTSKEYYFLRSVNIINCIDVEI